MKPVVGTNGSLTVHRSKPGVHMPAHAHSYDKVSLVLGGSARERHAKTDRVLQPGCLITKPAGVQHEDWVGDKGLCTLTLVANPTGESAESWQSAVEDYRCLTMDRSLKGLLKLACANVERPDDVIEQAVYLLAHERFRSETVHDDWYARAVSRLRSAHAAPPTLEQLAYDVAVHPVTLSRAFKRHGTSKSQIVHVARAREAMRLLGTERPVATIAVELGYADAAHFSRSFRMFAGLTPSQFRSRFAKVR